jgi:membrane-bound lytic murein transglycosylase B
MITPSRRRTLVVLATMFAAGFAGSSMAALPRHGVTHASRGYAKRADVRRFIDELARNDGFPKARLAHWLREARYQRAIVDAMERPLVEPPKWYEYSPRFLTPGRADAGVAFWRAHEPALSRAEAQFGVPPEIIVAIIGIESNYGHNTGRYRVIDALATLAFDYPRRGSYFRAELREYFLFARDERISPLTPRGSFAGAMGIPQFMPGNVRRYAVDFDGDGRIDLWNSGDDVIGSVANYLARHDWLRGQPVWSRAIVAESARDAALARLDGGISERRPLAAWNADGIGAQTMPEPMSAQPVGLLLLEERPDPQLDGRPVGQPDAQPDTQPNTQEGAAAAPLQPAVSLWIVFPNFYVITRYNKSRLYAAAVASLAEALRAAHDAPVPPVAPPS